MQSLTAQSESKPPLSWKWLRFVIAWNAGALTTMATICVWAAIGMRNDGEALAAFVGGVWPLMIVWSLTGVGTCLAGALLPQAWLPNTDDPKHLTRYVMTWGLHFVTGPLGFVIGLVVFAAPSGWTQWVLVLLLGSLGGFVLTFWCLLCVNVLVLSGFKAWAGFQFGILWQQLRERFKKPA